MPLYEYFCKKCGTIEVRQSISDKPLEKCPNCDKQVTRIMSTTGTPQFKGKGFYQTDYKKSGS